MYRTLIAFVALFGLIETAGAATNCGRDAAAVGPTCVDKFEASIWNIPSANTRLINKVKNGNASLADLQAGGATPLSIAGDPDYDCNAPLPATFPATGNWTEPVYAASLPGVQPSGCVTWFQAEQACRLSGKRLLTNQEWQAAAAGTPEVDPYSDTEKDCNTNGDRVRPTGSATSCISKWGVMDMSGNVVEWVADWVPKSTGCASWTWSTPVPPSVAGDDMCLAGASTSEGPGALLRGGGPSEAYGAGIFAVSGFNSPSGITGSVIGFRCGR